MIPTDAKARKRCPIATGVLDYFPDAIAAIAECSYLGNEQHNFGEPLHWARDKSTDQDDALLRHFMERGTLDTDGVRHSTKMAWRALAILQLEIERAARRKVLDEVVAESQAMGFYDDHVVGHAMEASDGVKVA